MLRNPNYEIIKKLGSGAGGTVYKAIRKSDEKTIALKIISAPPSGEVYDSAIKEVEMLEKISNPCQPNLACYYGHYYDESERLLYIEMEYIDGEDLFDYAKKLRDNKEYTKLYKYLLLIVKDLIKAIIYVHQNGILHNDIKPENIIIDTELTPVLIDFGLSCKTMNCILNKEKIECCTGYSGTPVYASPEMYKKQIRYPASDIWSLGMTLYHVATGKIPYLIRGRLDVDRISYAIVNRDPLKLETSNEMLNDIVNRALVRDPSKRITGTEIDEILSNL